MESGCAMQPPDIEDSVSTNINESSMDPGTQQDCVSPENQAGPSESSQLRDMKLPKCYVLLHRLTDEDISHLCPSHSGEISEDVWSKTEELLQKTEESVNEDGHVTYGKHGTKRRLRASNRRTEKFELYKKRRQNFINRRNRVSHSDNSLDWSPDEFGEKAKKKLKRGRKYELDFEWCPSKPKDAVQSSRNLRRQVRRPVIDSDSSSSNEEDELFNYYVKEFHSDMSSDRSVSVNSVPSSFTYEHVDTSGLTFSGMNLSMKNQKPSQSPKPCLPNSDAVSGDLISGIIKDMNELKGTNIPASTKSSTANFKPVQKGRKRLKMNSVSPKSKNNTEKEVATLLLHMMRTVTNQVKQLDGTKKKFSKVCKWCSTPFATNSEKEIMCAICWDLGKGKFSRGNPYIKRSPTKTSNVKGSKENKVTKKKSNAISQVLKKLPKSERQRLMYAEKSDKMSFEKGYNHCKSFNTPKDIREDSLSKNNSNIHSSVKNLNSINNITSKYSSTNPDFIVKNANSNSAVSQNNRISAKKKPNVQDKTIRQCIEFAKSFASSSKKNSSQITQPVPAKNSSNKYEQIRNNKVVLKSMKDGMFQIKFPDNDKNCEPKVSIQNENKVTTNNSFSSPNSTHSDKHDTYLFPPIPTVIVHNYCRDTNGLNLSHTYFQNELTHKHALKSSNLPSVNKKAETVRTCTQDQQMIGILKSAYSNACRTTSNILPNNASLTFTTVPVNTINQILPLSANTSTVYTTLIPSTPKSVTLMPVVSSIVSLSNKNLSISPVEKNSANIKMDRFMNNNFVNSQDPGIKITSVSTEKSSNLKNTDQSASSLNMPIGLRIMPVNAESKQKDSLQTVNMNTNQNSEYSSNTDKSDLNAEKSAKPPVSNVLQQSCRPTDTTENATKSAMDVIGAVSILAVIDLEKNPLTGLNYRIHVTKDQLAKLTTEQNVTPELNDKISSCQNNLQLLNIAKKYLSLHGSFTKVSDFFLRKTQIQIKKEIFEESTQSSCMYSNSSSNNSSINNNIDDNRMSEISAPPVANKVDNFNSCQLNEQMSINHIQKLQSQIAAMNNAQRQHYEDLAYTVHHYPEQQFAALPPAVAAPTPVTPRNDCMGVESRETPSRGSGPRTPARPESAASQSEEPSMIQIKKEQMEAASSSPSQCAYSQNTTTTTTPVPQVPSQITVMPEIPALNMSDPSLSNALHQIPVNNTNQLYHNQSNIHPQLVGPNRTISYNNNSNSYSLLNITSKQQLNPVASNPDMRQNRQVLMGQQMYIQNNVRQSVPSVNNQLVIRPPYVSANNGGTLIVNNSPMGQNALLTNVSNQQFYTNQVSQLYYPPSTQISCVPTSQSVAITPIQNQQAEIPADQMVCAVCQKQATLRCKQCARVAYCNTTCAKTYWHQKHKMECKPLPS